MTFSAVVLPIVESRPLPTSVRETLSKVGAASAARQAGLLFDKIWMECAESWWNVVQEGIEYQSSMLSHYPMKRSDVGAFIVRLAGLADWSGEDYDGGVADYMVHIVAVPSLEFNQIVGFTAPPPPVN